MLLPVRCCTNWATKASCFRSGQLWVQIHLKVDRWDEIKYTQLVEHCTPPPCPLKSLFPPRRKRKGGESIYRRLRPPHASQFFVLFCFFVLLNCFFCLFVFCRRAADFLYKREIQGKFVWLICSPQTIKPPGSGNDSSRSKMASLMKNHVEKSPFLISYKLREVWQFILARRTLADQAPQGVLRPCTARSRPTSAVRRAPILS